MRSDQFSQACEILWGPGWRRCAAAFLDVSERNVNYWAAGNKPIPPGIVLEITGHMADRATLMSAFLRQLNHGAAAA